MKNIITIQHTQSIHHINGMVGSWTDWDLSDLGKVQADVIGRNLKNELNGKKYIVYASDLKRTKQTANIIAKYLKIEPIFTDILRERNLGEAVGKSVQWLRENIEIQERTVDDRMFKSAESRRDVWNRLKIFYNEIMESNDENIIIVSHGDTLSVFNVMWLGLSVEALNSIDLFGRAGGVSIMQESDDGKHRIFKLSDLSYMKE